MYHEMTLQDFIDQTKLQEMKKDCPVMYALNLISGKWEVKTIFYLIKYGTVRFNEFKKYIPGITNTMLTSTLKKLENAKVVQRIQYNEVPPHVEYKLTDSGDALASIMFELAKWGEKYQIIPDDNQ